MKIKIEVKTYNYQGQLLNENTEEEVDITQNRTCIIFKTSDKQYFIPKEVFNGILK